MVDERAGMVILVGSASKEVMSFLEKWDDLDSATLLAKATVFTLVLKATFLVVGPDTLNALALLIARAANKAEDKNFMIVFFFKYICCELHYLLSLV